MNAFTISIQTTFFNYQLILYYFYGFLANVNSRSRSYMSSP